MGQRQGVSILECSTMNGLSMLCLFSSKAHEHCGRRAKRLLESEAKEEQDRTVSSGYNQNPVCSEAHSSGGCLHSIHAVTISACRREWVLSPYLELRRNYCQVLTDYTCEEERNQALLGVWSLVR